MMKDFLSDIPENNDEVEEFFDSYNDKVRAAAAKGLFKCLRMQGKDLIPAYKETLLAVVGKTKNNLVAA